MNSAIADRAMLVYNVLTSFIGGIVKRRGLTTCSVIGTFCLVLLLAVLATACGGKTPTPPPTHAATPSSSPQADTAPPQTTSDAPSGWQKAAVTVTLTATDDSSGVATTSYRLDHGSWKTGTHVRVKGNGTHRLVYFSKDKAGNVESKNTSTIKINTTRPVTQALSSPMVQKGHKAVLKFRVRDLTPKAQVSIRVKGKVNKTYALGWRRTGKTLSFAEKFPVGNYTYVVYAKDQAGNTAATKGSASFQVKDVRYLARIGAAVSDAHPAQYSDVTASCRALDQFGQPIAGVAVSFTWHYKTVSHTERYTTGSDGVARSTRWISRATIGWYVQIGVSASWQGRTLQSSTGFTPQ